MIHVDDNAFDLHYFERCFARFDRHPVLGRCERERIAVCLTDAAYWLALCLYVKERGGTVYPLAADTPREAARRRAERSGCTYLVFGTDAEAALESIEPVERSSDAALTLDKPALIQTSSGTTGEPKFIARSWTSIDVEIASYIRGFDAGALATIVACPITHSYGLISGVLVALQRGVRANIVTNPNPKYILRKLSETRASLLYSSPTLLTTIALLASEDNPLYAVMTSGTLLQGSSFESLRKKVRHVHQQYGCSEAGCVTLGQDISAANELGKPLPHLALAAGTSAAEPHEIVVTVDGKTVDTRDLGYFEGSNLHFVSRLDDMINVAGLNVYPSEVEEAVLAMPGVTDAVVFKRKQSFGSDQVCLSFVADRTLAPRDIRAWCATQLAAHQVPMSMTQVESIPRLPNGKVSRKTLAEAADRRDASSLSAKALS